MTKKTKIVNIDEINKTYNFLGLPPNPEHYNYILDRAIAIKSENRSLSKQAIINQCIEEIFGKVFNDFELIKDERNTDSNSSPQGGS